MRIEDIELKREVRHVISKERFDSYRKILYSVREFKQMKLAEDISCKRKFKQLWRVIKPTLEIIVIMLPNKIMRQQVQNIISKGDYIMCETKINELHVSDFISQLSMMFSKIEEQI
ncbi:MAG: hypothetical protein A2033_15280 [Bacteroidetes bacterium GWA2_31_9]|nr:MAG: hypothetical protein A2033_15280 [Bacteroidetes bacterium GWA2_31_9]